MKIRTISRSIREHTRERPQDLQRVQRNLDPMLHPFAKQREYVRALNSAKLSKVFAKPFVAQLEGHTDGVYSCATSPCSLVAYLSGDGQGVIKVWDLAHKKQLWSVNAHRGVVMGLTCSNDGRYFFSCGKDKTVKQYRLAVRDNADSDSECEGSGDDTNDVPLTWSDGAISSWTGTTPFNGIDHHWRHNSFATCSDKIEVWDHSRSAAISTFTWGADKIKSCKFNPAEAGLLGSVANDRNIVLYDVRGNTAVRKIVMDMSSNALAWNPMEPMNFTVANEDSNLYTFDMRKMESALMVHKDHLSAVMDISYSPTGREFVSGSYDRTVRLFNVRQGKSREVYHTRRMQRVFCVHYSADSQYVLSGSNDTNIRIWKAQASKALGRLLPREKKKQKYNRAIMKKYGEVSDIKKITRHRHLPKVLMKMRKRKAEQLEKSTRKMKNIRRHSKPGSIKTVPQRQKNIVRAFD